jgi:hypothetical protein
MKLYQRLANKISAIRNCEASGNSEWLDRHEDELQTLVKEHLPSGAGFDAGTTLDYDLQSTPERLVFQTSFHHMSEHGYYIKWTEHSVIVTPSLQHGINIRVTGRDYRDIKEYIAECFHTALNQSAD